jgi:hypothetical protein
VEVANRGVARKTTKRGRRSGNSAGQIRGPDVDVQSTIFSYYRMR